MRDDVPLFELGNRVVAGRGGLLRFLFLRLGAVPGSARRCRLLGPAIHRHHELHPLQRLPAFVLISLNAGRRDKITFADIAVRSGSLHP